MTIAQRRSRIWMGTSFLLACGLLLSWWSASWAIQTESVPAEQLVPESAFLVAKMDGRLLHAIAYEQTAEYDAFYKSGLADLFGQLVEFLVSRDDSGTARKGLDFLTKTLDEGVFLAAYLNQPEQPIPGAVLVINGVGGWFDELVKPLQEMAREKGEQITVETISGRRVAQFVIPESPGIVVGLWAEGKNLVLVAGPDAVNVSLGCATGNMTHLGNNASWNELQNAELDFERNSSLLLDWELLKQRYGEIVLPLPAAEELNVNDVLTFIGLDKLETVTMQAGYKGPALWSETVLQGIGSSQPAALSFEGLPPLPAKFTSFYAAQTDLSALHDQLLAMARQIAKLVGERESAQLEQKLGEANRFLGFDIKADLLEKFGDTVCVYDDANGGIFGMGTTVCISLKDGSEMADFLSRQMDRLEEAEENGEFFEWPIYPIRIEKDDAELIVFDLYDNDESIQMGALSVVGDWLVIGIMPQSIAAFKMRLAGELPSFAAQGDYVEAMAIAPKKFHSFSCINVRETYQLVLNILNSFLPFLQKAMIEEEDFLDENGEIPFYVEDFPPAERVTHSLFPNSFYTVSTETETRIVGRASTYGLPISGSNNSTGIVAGAAVGTALLLPAGQQAREAARRTSSSNNLKQIGLSMHNFHDTHGHFPQGTFPHAELKPDQRLAWTYQLLPFIEQAVLYDQIDPDAAWDSENNQSWADVSIPVFQNPSQTDNKANNTHYVGMAGVGKDAPELPVTHERAGVFGYDRKTRFRDITDGLSNTIMVMTANKNLGPWLQGGTSTLRSLTKKPYVNGPDGLGSPSGSGVMQALMGDGAVRNLSENIDPKLLENLVKIRDGNVINVLGDF